MTTRGERLSAYLNSRTGGRHGWQADLVRSSGVKRQTITKWTRSEFDGYPDPEALAAVAQALGVKPWEIVRAMDGDEEPLPIDEATRAALRAEIEAVLDERLGPRKAARGPERAAG